MASRMISLLLVASATLSTASAAEPTEGPAVVTSPAAAAPAERSESETPPTNNSATRSQVRQTTADRLELDTTVVTGNRELPKVLYIVPWKKADLGELPAQPFNTLLDEVLTPVDRDVFRREVTYFEAVTEGADATQSTVRPQE